MYCPNCKQDFEDIDFCPCCVDDNGDSIKLIPTPAEEPELDNGEINIHEHIKESDVTDTDAVNTNDTDVDKEESKVAEDDNNSEQTSSEIDRQLLFEIQQQLHQEMGLEPGWMSEVKNFCVSKDDGSCEEGYRLAYEDMRKKFGRKLWIEVDKSGKVTRVITTK